MSVLIRAFRSAAGPLRCVSGTGAFALKPRISARLFWTSRFQPSAVSSADDIANPDRLNVVTGDERAEIIARLTHQKSYEEMFEPIYDTHIGTDAQPILVGSAYDERIVGCTGGAGDAYHDVMWINVKTGTKDKCNMCGQVFSVQPYEALEVGAKTQIKH